MLNNPSGFVWDYNGLFIEVAGVNALTQLLIISAFRVQIIIYYYQDLNRLIIANDEQK